MVVNFFVNLEPSRLFLRGEDARDAGEFFDDILADTLDEFFAFGRDTDENAAAIIRVIQAFEVAQFDKAVNQSGGGGGCVGHFFGDFAHGEGFVWGEVAEEKELGKRDLAPGEFRREMLNEASLHHHDDACEALDLLAGKTGVVSGHFVRATNNQFSEANVNAKIAEVFRTGVVQDEVTVKGARKRGQWSRGDRFCFRQKGNRKRCQRSRMGIL